MADPQLPENWKRVRSAIYAKAAPSLKIRDRTVERMMERVRAVVDWLEPADTPVLRSYCELEVLSRQAYATLRATGILSAKTGEVQAAAERLSAAEADTTRGRDATRVDASDAAGAKGERQGRGARCGRRDGGRQRRRAEGEADAGASRVVRGFTRWIDTPMIQLQRGRRGVGETRLRG